MNEDPQILIKYVGDVILWRCDHVTCPCLAGRSSTCTTPAISCILWRNRHFKDTKGSRKVNLHVLIFSIFNLKYLCRKKYYKKKYIPCGCVACDIKYNNNNIVTQPGSHNSVSELPFWSKRVYRYMYDIQHPKLELSRAHTPTTCCICILHLFACSKCAHIDDLYPTYCAKKLCTRPVTRCQASEWLITTANLSKYRLIILQITSNNQISVAIQP
jgi:hypothetical protein